MPTDIHAGDDDRKIGESEGFRNRMTFSVLSIIICTKNRRNDLAITLQSVFLQSHLPDSVIIIDDSVTQDTEDLIRECSATVPIRLVYIRSDKPHSGLPAARNTGIRNLPAATEIVLFLDDDVTLEKTYLESMLSVFRTHPEITGCTGHITNDYSTRPAYEKFLLWIIGTINPVLVPASLVHPSVTWTGEALSPLFPKPERTHTRAEWLSGSNMAYRGNVFSDGHFFDEHLTRYALGEDLLFSHLLFREGKDLSLVYTARLVHRVSSGDRIPSLSRFVMTIGYRRYVLKKFFGQTHRSDFAFPLFVVQFISAAFILSLKQSGNLQYWKEALKGYYTARRLIHTSADGDLGKINEFCSLYHQETKG